MKNRTTRQGFTLVELLVATTMITVILSMVYGTYFAVSRSTRMHKAGTDLSGRLYAAVQQIARELRCAYAEARPAPPPDSKNNRPGTGNFSSRSFNYFRGGLDPASGEFLHFVTAAEALAPAERWAGHVELIYTFDRAARTILSSRRKLVQTATESARPGRPTVLLGDVERIDLAFFDGRQWVDQWDFARNKILPPAVKISITCRDENGRQYNYAAVAHICCSNYPGRHAPPGKDTKPT